MVGCLIVPYCLASLNLAFHPTIFNSRLKKVGHILIMIAFYPFLPFLLIIMEHKSLLECTYCSQDHVIALTNRYKTIKFQTAQFVRTELCIEQTLQLTFSILLLVFSKSTTRTAQGLEVLFDETIESTSEATLGITAEMFLVLNNVLSLYSAWNAYVRGMSATKNRFPLMSRLVLGLFVSLSIAIKCFTSIFYLAPCLGLMDLLRLVKNKIQIFNLQSTRINTI